MPNQIAMLADIFDRRIARLHRERAARMGDGAHPLLRALAEEMADRLLGVRKEFHDVLELGGGGASVAALLPPSAQRNVALSDVSEYALRRVDSATLAVVADEENLPFAEGRFDLVISLLSLSSVNDVQGHLLTLKRALRPGGLFMAAMAGGETFADLRSCLMEAELDLCDGAGSRFSPMINMVSASRLLSQAGFALPIVDREFCVLTYSDIFALMHDLRGAGMTALHHKHAREWLPRSAFVEAERLYRSRHESLHDRLAVRLELYFLHGWQGG
ncbi:MAG: methyltransferase domain-containing protein [Bdellovibrionales bacterium]